MSGSIFHPFVLDNAAGQETVVGIGSDSEKYGVGISSHTHITGIQTVDGFLHAGGGIKDTSGDLGNSGQVLSSTGSGLNWINPGDASVENASNIGVNLYSTNADQFVAFVGASSGNNPVRVDAGIKYNPSSNLLTVGSITGSIAASNVNSGTLGVDRIPSLPASKITSGQLDAARIPTLNQNTTGNAATATSATTAGTVTTAAQTNITSLGTLTGLTVNGNIIQSGTSNYIRISGGLQDKDGQDGNSGQVLSSTGTQVNWINVGDISAGSASQVAVSDESSDTTCFPLFVTASTGNQSPKSGSNLTFNSSTGVLSATSFSGSIAASNINSGTLGTDRIPSLAASKITSGTLGTDRIPSLAASKITSGTLATGRIPNLAASKITSGTLGTDRIPSLAASKITSGQFDTARIPTLNQNTTGTSGGLSGSPSITVTNITIDGQLRDGDNGFGSSGQVLSSDGTDTKWINAGSLSAGAAALVAVNATNSTNSSHFIAFTETSSGNEEIRVDNSLTYNPSTNVLTAGTFSGGLPITSGANNRVITASSASAIQGESNLTFDGTKLDIITNGAGFRITRNGQYLELDGNFGNGGDQLLAASANFRIQTGGVGNSFERVRILSDGKVGIGTNLPNRIMTIVDGPGGGIGVIGTNAGIYMGTHHTGGFQNNAAMARAAADNFHISGSVAGDLCIASESSAAMIFGLSHSAGAMDQAVHINRLREFNIYYGAQSIKIHTGNPGSPTERLRIDSSGHLKLPNNAFIRLGDAQTSSGTLRIYSNGTQSYISPGITGNHIRFLNSGSTSQVELYYGTSQKLSTQSYGILVQGNVSATNNLSCNNNLLCSGTASVANTLTVTGSEGTDAILELLADDGDDNDDKWRIRSDATGNDLKFETYTSGSWSDGSPLQLASNGIVTMPGQAVIDEVNINGNVVQTNTSNELVVRGKGTGGSHHLKLDDDVTIVGDLTVQGVGGFKTGMIILWSGLASNIPSGFVLCDGQNSTPDLRGRFVVGYSNTDNDYDVGDTGGNKQQTLSINQIPSHTHSYSSANYPTSSGPEQNQSGGPEDRTTFNVSKTTGSTGGGQPVDVRPPYYALCYIMKT